MSLFTVKTDCHTVNSSSIQKNFINSKDLIKVISFKGNLGRKNQDHTKLVFNGFATCIIGSLALVRENKT